MEWNINERKQREVIGICKKIIWIEFFNILCDGEDSPRRTRGEEDARGGGRLQLLFEQNQNGVVEILHGKAAGRGSKDGVIPGDSAENAFRFP